MTMEQKMNMRAETSFLEDPIRCPECGSTETNPEEIGIVCQVCGYLIIETYHPENSLAIEAMAG